VTLVAGKDDLFAAAPNVVGGKLVLARGESVTLQHLKNVWYQIA